MAMFFVGTPSQELALRAESAGSAIEGLSGGSTGVRGYHGNPRLNETLVGNEAWKSGVFGASEIGPGVLGYARSDDQPGVYAAGGVLALPYGNQFAGEFRGNVKVTGDVLLSGADCAEEFDVVDSDHVEPGAVLVIDDGGRLRECDAPYDTKVAGVVTGAGEYRPGVILDSQGSDGVRLGVSLVGKAYCKVDADHGPIAVGDLLTTSATPGHAMRAGDRERSFGAVLGKALREWDQGSGMIPAIVLLG